MKQDDEGMFENAFLKHKYGYVHAPFTLTKKHIVLSKAFKAGDAAFHSRYYLFL